jgi:hypothetical protein
VASAAVRLFVLSTFRDMRDERYQLMKQVFPQLRHLCAQRSLEWAVVDFRWGITHEQRAEEAVLSWLCSARIRFRQVAKHFARPTRSERYDRRT